MAARATIMSTFARPLASRAVSIKIEPRTLDIRESRAVLRALKRYGDVDSFQNLQHDPVDPAPHRIHAVFRTEQAASRLIADCPLTVAVEAPSRPLPVHSPASSQLPYLVAEAKATQHSKTSAPQPEGRSFTLSAEMSTADHRASVIQQQQYWGYSAVRNRFTTEALYDAMPVRGYAVPPTPGKTVPARVVRKNLEEVAARRSVAEMLRDGSIQG